MPKTFKSLNDFELDLNKDSVKQGKAFKSHLTSSSSYGKENVFWTLSGDGITKSDLKDGNLQGQATLKKDGSTKQIFEIAANSERTQNATLDVDYFLDPKFKTRVAGDSIAIVAKSYDPDKDSSKPWSMNAARSQVKENILVQFTINNGTPGETVFYTMSGKGIDKNDFDLSYARTSGKAKMDNTGKAQIPVMVRNDNKTEGTEDLTVSIFADKGYKKKLSSKEIPILDTSVETPEQGPTKSKTPSGKQPVWSNKPTRELGSHSHRVGRRSVKIHQHVPGLIQTTKVDWFFITKQAAKVSIRTILIFPMPEPKARWF